MTVTLTVEQLRAYQKSMEEWALNNAYAEALSGAITTLTHDPLNTRNKFEMIRSAAKEWLDKNPMPKLCPPELEA